MSRQTIAEFLEARIAEDKEEAEHFLERYKQGEDISKRRWLRVLREAEAKQAIIDDWEDPNGAGVWEGYDYGCALTTDRAARALAAVYKDHPDYRQEWAA